MVPLQRLRPATAAADLSVSVARRRGRVLPASASAPRRLPLRGAAATQAFSRFLSETFIDVFMCAGPEGARVPQCLEGRGHVQTEAQGAAGGEYCAQREGGRQASRGHSLHPTVTVQVCGRWQDPPRHTRLLFTISQYFLVSSSVSVIKHAATVCRTCCLAPANTCYIN